MKYRRSFTPGGTYFFTAVTFNRLNIFTSDLAVELLRKSILDTMIRYPFKIQAAVILPDHIHMIWQLPDGDWNYPTRWRLIKSHFTRSWKRTSMSPTTESRRKKGEQSVWQRRYWEHQIRDEEDWRRHVDYIHYNPIKHGLVNSPAEWVHSSFGTFVKQGLYPMDWGADIDLKLEIGPD